MDVVVVYVKYVIYIVVGCYYFVDVFGVYDF